MSDSKEKTVAFVLPVLNELESIPKLYARILSVMADQPEEMKMLFVDDGSTDGSAEWVAAQAGKDPRVSLLCLSRNFGHQAAITAGLDHVEADAVVIMDADMQDPPEVVPDLIAKWRQGYDVVNCVRQEREGESWSKKLLAGLFYRFFRMLTRMDAPVDSGDFRLLDMSVVRALREMRETHRYLRGMTAWIGFKQCSVQYVRQGRSAGLSKYPISKSLRLAWDGMTSFSGTPLCFLWPFGCVVALAGLVWAAVLVVSWFTRGAAAGAGQAVIAGVLIVAGVQLFCAGMLGEYLSRTFEEAKRRPLYFVRKDRSLASRLDE